MKKIITIESMYRQALNFLQTSWRKWKYWLELKRGLKRLKKYDGYMVDVFPVISLFGEPGSEREIRIYKKLEVIEAIRIKNKDRLPYGVGTLKANGRKVE